MSLHGGSMIVSLEGKIAEDIWMTNKSRSLPKKLWVSAKALMTIMHATNLLKDLSVKEESPTLRLHRLTGDKKEYWSITIKLPWCITFKYNDGEFHEVKIENDHRG